MRIEATSTRLVFYNRPWRLCFFSTIIPIVGLPILFEMFQVHSLVCYRSEQVQSTCRISHLTIFGVTSSKLPLSELKEAKVKSVRSSRGPTYNIVLVTDKGVLDFRPYSDSFDSGKQEIVHHINAFLQDSKQLNLSVKQYPDLTCVLILAIYIYALILFFRSWQITTCTFDKRLGILNIKRQSLLGLRITEYPLHQITRVIDATNSDKSTLIELVSLQLASGKYIRVYRDTKLGINWEADTVKVATLIREFLNLSA